MQFVLPKVDKHFKELIMLKNIPRPRIHIAPHINFDTSNRNPVSVRFLLRRAGRNSGIILRIKDIIKDKNWANAWLRLQMTGINWYDITDITYNN